jgi:Zinc finger, C3HC4 type (RING finger)
LSSQPCQHIFCDSCLSKVGDGENIRCPSCRKQSNVESLEAVEFTATQQWDQLLEIARHFAEMERRMGPDTSEEEEEEALRENFISDDDVEARFVATAGLSEMLTLQWGVQHRFSGGW